MRENYTLPRLYVEAPLNAAASIELTKEQAHYLGNVLRKSCGDFVRIFNGESGEWRAEITEMGKRAGGLKLTEQLRPPKACPDITLAFAPVRKQRTAFIIEKATELGARALQPVLTARTQYPKFNQDRARLQAIEAAEQTERLNIPEIGAPIKLADFAAGVSGHVIFADEGGDAALAIEALAGLPAPATILIGPEGGFTDQEREMLRAQAFVTPVSLGPRILRADTAALSLLTLWQAVNGDWSETSL